MEQIEKNFSLRTKISILVGFSIIIGAIYMTDNRDTIPVSKETSPHSYPQAVTKVVLPVIWDDLGQKMTSIGIIDKPKFAELYEARGGLSEDDLKLLNDVGNGNLVITEQNASYVLNLLWALGIASKNPVLENGEMSHPAFGGDPSRFASTGGWTLSSGDTMDHYSMHKFFNLTPEQQGLVEKVSRGIFRPCCNNSVHFPDCNHGMAMLGLLELMASQGSSEEEMYKYALEVNSLWFPDTYDAIREYYQQSNIDWSSIKPETLLGKDHSSADGYRNISSKIKPIIKKPSQGCSA